VRVDAEIVIGADGIRSKVRENLLRLRAAPIRRRGSPAGDLSDRTAAWIGIADCTKWWGPDQHILPYFMTGRRDEIYVIGVIPSVKWDSDASFATL